VYIVSALIDVTLARHPICNRVFERSYSPELKPTDRPTDRPTDARSGGGLQLPVVVSPRTHRHVIRTQTEKRAPLLSSRGLFLSFTSFLIASLFLSNDISLSLSLSLSLVDEDQYYTRRKRRHTTKPTIALTIGTYVDSREMTENCV